MVRLASVRGSAGPRSSPAASSSASRWPARWCSSPKLVLMDEPLGALDKQLREHMQIEIKHLHERLGVTDGLRHARPGRGADDVGPHRGVQRRAASSSSTRPGGLYEKPRTPFVARFIGENNSPATAASMRARGALHMRRALAATRERARDGVDGGRCATGGAGRPSSDRSGCTIRRRAYSRRTRNATAGTLREVIYLGDHVPRAPERAGNDDFMREAPDRAARRRRRGRRGVGWRDRCCARARAAAARVARSQNSQRRSAIDEQTTSGDRRALAARGRFARRRAQARDLTVVSWGGAYQDAQRKAYLRAVHGEDRHQDRGRHYNGGLAKIKAKIDSNNVTWDIIDVERPKLVARLRRGLFENARLEAKIGGKSTMTAGATFTTAASARSSGPPSRLRRRQAPGDTPKSWADFFDTEEIPRQARRCARARSTTSRSR